MTLAGVVYCGGYFEAHFTECEYLGTRLMQQFHFLDVGLDLWQSKVFFALPLLTVVLWLVSNKVEKEQKKSTISLLKVQHLICLIGTVTLQKRGSHSCSSIIESV